MNLADRLRADHTIHTAWSAIPDPLVGEFLARSAFDAVTLDMQHGCHTTDSVLRGVAAVTLAGKPAVVRVPVGRFDMASRALDFGASAVIAPMVNSQADAEAFAGFMKFPPLGERSWGPTRVLGLQGKRDSQDYLRSANRETIAIAMIETRAALKAVDQIIGVEGIDGVFVGPSDFSIALSDGARVDPVNAEMLDQAQKIAEKARAAGKFAGVMVFTPEMSRQVVDMGFRFIALSNDFNYLTSGASALVDACKKPMLAAAE